MVKPATFPAVVRFLVWRKIRTIMFRLGKIHEWVVFFHEILIRIVPSLSLLRLHSAQCMVIIIIINPFPARVVGAPQMILQPVFSILPCSSLPSETCRTPGLSIPWCCLPTSSSVCLVFFPLSLCLARWFWPDLMNGKHDHAYAPLYDHQEVFVWSNCLLDLGADFLVGNMVFVWDV